jgi:lipopolysaccharide export system protein LptC
MVLLLIVVFIIGWLVGAKQEQKRILNPKQYTPEPEVVEKLQTLAGIKEHDSTKGVEILVEINDNLDKKKDVNGNKLLTELLNAANIETKSDNDKK